MVTIEELQDKIAVLTEQQNDMMRIIFQLSARSVLMSPEKRLVVGIANRVALEKLELNDTYDEEILYKNSRKTIVKSKLTLEEEEDITQAQFLCWHLLQKHGGMSQDEVALEYGFSSYVKHTTKKMGDMGKTATGRALIAGAESRFLEEFKRCIVSDD